MHGDRGPREFKDVVFEDVAFDNSTVYNYDKSRYGFKTLQ